MPGSLLYLASASPRRLELLRQIHIEPRVQVADMDETPLPQEGTEAMVRRLALAKAVAVAKRLHHTLPVSEHAGCWVLGADTTGVIDRTILLKPESRQDAIRMWRLMMNRRHQVLTAIALVNVRDTQLCFQALSVSEVEFGFISDADMERYWQSGEPQDKAGAYAIQGYAACWVKNFSGSYSGIVGLPLYETKILLQQAGLADL